MMNKSRAQILQDLLFELDRICRENDLKYTLTGAFIYDVMTEGKLPDDLTNLSVAMTLGDIERLIEVVNNGDGYREVEFALNNPYARNFQVRFCNNETTLINIRSYRHHVNYGIYVRILEIEKDLKGRQASAYRILRAMWKGSAYKLSECSTKQLLPVAVLKIVRCLIGRRRATRWLYNYKKRLTGIDKWEDIQAAGREALRIGKRKIELPVDTQLCDISIEGHKVCVWESLLGYSQHAADKNRLRGVEEIIDTGIPFREAINGEIKNVLDSAKNDRNHYLSVVRNANKARKIKNNAWNVYLMTRDVVRLRQGYEQSADYTGEVMEEYFLIKNKWQKAGIPFIEIPEIENMAEYRTQTASK